MPIGINSSIQAFRNAADEAVNQGDRQLVWGVFDNYLLKQDDYHSEPYFYAPVDLPDGLRGRKEPFQLLLNPYLRDPWSDGQALRLYSPLNVPGLFLEFASLADDPGLDDEPYTQNNEAAALDWVKSYGVLGLSETGFDSLTGLIHQGGKWDRVSSFVEAAEIANATLRLFEAATAPEGPDIDFIQAGMPENRRHLIVHDPDTGRDWALNRVGEVLGLSLEEYCYPTFRIQEDGLPSLAWRFRNLLGAMWIQMMWLFTSTSDTRRCARRGCTRIITFEPGEPPADPGVKKNPRGKYKTRKDKKFCSTLCRVKNHQQVQGQRKTSAEIR